MAMQKSLTGRLPSQHPKSNTVDTDIDALDEQDSTRNQTNSADNTETEAYKTPIRITNEKPYGAKSLKPRSLKFTAEEEAAHPPGGQKEDAHPPVGGQKEDAHLPGGQEEDAHLCQLLQQLSIERNAVQPLLQGTETFNWQDLSRHIQKKSPKIHDILSAIAGDDNELAVVMAASILFNNNETSNPSSIQHSLGIILEHEGASQKTKELLHKLRLCAHPSTTKDWIKNNHLVIDTVIETRLQTATIPFEIICDNLVCSKFSIYAKQENWHWFLALYMEKRIVGGDKLDNKAPKRDIDSLDCREFIPDPRDIESLQKNIDFHIARVLVANLKFLQDFKTRVQPPCISHKYIEQSKKPSRKIGMKVFDANQQKHNDMRNVMGELMKTTAVAQARQERRLVLGGDVVTCREASKAARQQEKLGSKSPVYRPEGFHRLINLLQIIYEEFFDGGEKDDRRILWKIWNSKKRKYVSGSEGVRKNYRANERFLDDVLDAYILKEAKQHFGMERGGEPTKNIPPLLSTYKQKRKWLYTQARTIQRMMVNFDFRPLRLRIKNFLKARKMQDARCKMQQDAPPRIPHLKVFLTMCFVARDTSDAYRMCDGNRAFRNAKFEFLYTFGSGNHPHYKRWLWNMLAYVSAVLTKRQAVEYKWNIGVNVEGGTGNNIPNDEFCEQYVQRLQNSIKDQGADKSFQLLQQNCNVSQIVEDMHDNFQRQGLIDHPETTEHTLKRDLNAVFKVIEVENNMNILDPTDEKKIDAEMFWKEVQSFKEDLGGDGDNRRSCGGGNSDSNRRRKSRWGDSDNKVDLGRGGQQAGYQAANTSPSYGSSSGGYNSRDNRHGGSGDRYENRNAGSSHHDDKKHGSGTAVNGKNSRFDGGEDRSNAVAVSTSSYSGVSAASILGSPAPPPPPPMAADKPGILGQPPPSHSSHQQQPPSRCAII